VVSGGDGHADKLTQLAALMRTFFEQALERARYDFARNDLDVTYTRSEDGDRLFLEREGVTLEVTLDRTKPAIQVTVAGKTMVELYYDLERGEIVTGSSHRPPNLHLIFTKAMSQLIDEVLGKST
jgi:hypothetical protein